MSDMNEQLDRALPLLGRLLKAHDRSAVFESGYLQIDGNVGDDDAAWGHEMGGGDQDDRLGFDRTLFVSPRLFHLAIRRSIEPAVVVEAPSALRTRATDTNTNTNTNTDAAEPQASGVDIVKAGFSITEITRIDLARGTIGRSTWARDVVLKAVRSGRPISRVSGAGGNPNYVNFRVSPPDAAALDKARGNLARAAFVRAALLAACS